MQVRTINTTGPTDGLTNFKVDNEIKILLVYEQWAFSLS